MRITVKELDALVARINRTLGYADGQLGCIRLYRAYGGYGVHRLMNTSGGVTSLLECVTARECRAFLRGMVEAIAVTADVAVASGR